MTLLPVCLRIRCLTTGTEDDAVVELLLVLHVEYVLERAVEEKVVGCRHLSKQMNCKDVATFNR
jgi:hypothetical protein